MTPVASGGELVEAGKRDEKAATFWCNSTKSYRIDSCNKSIANGQISQISRNLALVHPASGVSTLSIFRSVYNVDFHRDKKLEQISGIKI